MSEIFGWSLKHVVAAVFLSCTIASVVCAATAPNAPGRPINVNRIDKGDRLPVNPVRPVKPASTNSDETSPLPAPVGCEPVFSPVADPARARVIGRCLT